MTEKKALLILKKLKKKYGIRKGFLRHKSVFQLLVAVILSAQCTDVVVNKVCGELFKKYKTPEDFAGLKQRELEKIIRPTGFYKNKAKNIIKTSRMILKEFGGRVPGTMKELISLRGVARKTANIVLTEGFGRAEGIAVDTHVFRVSKRLGLSRRKTAEKVEEDLMSVYPKKDWRIVSNLFIEHGRKICNARKPICGVCFLRKECPSAFKV